MNVSPEHERYLWLRDGKSRNGGHYGSAPFVMDPNRSRLYAIASLRANALDASVDADIFDNKRQELHVANEVVERGLLPPGSRPDSLDEPYVEALEKLTQQALGWDDARVEAVKALEQS